MLLVWELLSVLNHAHLGSKLARRQSQHEIGKNPVALLDVQTLVEFGPRVAGTAATERTSSYLVQQYRQAGYVTSVQTFTYSKFVDQGSHLTVGAERSRVER